MDKATPASCAPAPSSLETKTASSGGSAALFPRGSAHAEENGGKEEASQGSPFETKGIFANVCRLPVVAEIIATLDVSGSHQGSVDSLEKHGDHSHEATQIATKSGAQSQQTSKQSEYSKAEGDEHEGEHESGHEEVVVMVGDEVVRDVDVGVEGAMRRRIKGEGRMDFGIGLISTNGAAIFSTADIPIRPARD